MAFSFGRLVVLVCFLCLVSSVSATPQVFSRFANFNEQYDISSTGTTVVQDHHGFYWLGTQQGLYRFDGGEVTHFKAKPLDPTALSADWVTSLMVADDNTLWVGTRYGGVNLFDTKTERFQRTKLIDEANALPVEVSAIYQDDAKRVWVAGYGAGLFYWDPATNKMVKMALPDEIDGVTTLYINDVWVSPNQEIWLASGEAPLRNKAASTGGLIRWSIEQQQGKGWHSNNSALAKDSISRIKVDRDQTLWFCSYGDGLWSIPADSNELIKAAAPDSVQTGILTDITFDVQGNLWLASYDNGLWYRDVNSKKWVHYNHQSEVRFGPHSPSIAKLMLDRQSTLWLVSQNGFSTLNHFAQKTHILPAGKGVENLLATTNIFGIHALSTEEVWLANREAGVARFNPATGTLQKFAFPISVEADISRAVLAEQNMVWVGTDEGLYQLAPDNASWTLFPLPHLGETQPVIAIIYQDSQDRLWLGSRGNGVYLLDENWQLLHHYHPAAEVYTLPFDSVTSILQAEDGAIWVGSADRGVVRGDPMLQQQKHWRQFEGGDHGLLFNGIQLIYQQRQGSIWVRAGNQDHRWLNNDQAPYFEVYDAESSDRPGYIAADEFRLLYRRHWLQGNQSFLELGELHGMQKSTWIGAWDIRDRVVYRGGAEGLDYYHIDELPQQQLIPTVKLTRFSLFNQTIRAGEYDFLPTALHNLDTLTLNYEQDMFSLRFAAPSLFQQELEYRYRLDGFDRDWIQTGFEERVATYTRLPPGDYQFQASVRLKGSNWQPSEILAIQILPPWWMTWWFRALVMALLVVSIWAWLHRKTLSERLMRQQLQQQVDKRTHELKEKHDALHASNQDLVLLQQISREVNASLDLEQVLSRCHQILVELIDVHVMLIGLHRPSKQEIEFVFWLENGQQAPVFSVDTDDLSILATICFQRKQEIHIHQPSDFLKYFSSMPKPLQGEAMQSVLYIPLLVNQQAVGVFSVQSPYPEAYSASQVDLLRTLANTIAIAVVNADTFTSLQQTQKQLVTQEKMASLGGLVAGIAHEINTPLGSCVTAASHLHTEFEQVQKAVANKTLRQSQFERFLEHLAEGLRILNMNIERAAKLVQSFKQVSVDQSSENLRDIDVADYLQEVLLSLQPQLRKLQCKKTLNCEESIKWNTDAGALAQIITNLVMNSLKHAFTDVDEPHIVVEAKVVGKELHLDYRDNGTGMSERDLARLFEPFYTTKRSTGGTGLGAHIVFNLVTVRLRGQISVHSEPEQGLRYHIQLPLDR